MDETVKKHIIRYINKKYLITENSFFDFNLTSIYTGGEVNLSNVYDELLLLFGIGSNELTKYINHWIDYEFNNFKINSGLDLEDKFYKQKPSTPSLKTATKIKIIYENNVKNNS